MVAAHAVVSLVALYCACMTVDWSFARQTSATEPSDDEHRELSALCTPFEHEFELRVRHGIF